MRNKEDVMRRLAACPIAKFGTGATEESIASAESALGVTIRGGYRGFLARFGCAMIGTAYVYGLGEMDGLGDVVKLTFEERHEFMPFLPGHLLPLMNNGAGDYFCVDTRTSAGGEPRIVQRFHDVPDEPPEVVATDFWTWISELIDLEEGRDGEAE